MSAEQRFSMKYVSRRTGLTPHTIRVWERRYGAVMPERTETNHRLYSEADIERLLLLRHATLAGHSIGQIANLPLEDLRELVKTDSGALPQKQPMAKQSETASAEESLAEAFKALEAFDRSRLERVLHHASASFSQPVLIERFLTPFLRGIGEKWREGTLRVAQEHFASAIIRGFLARLRRITSASATDPILLIATPSGQYHEFGAFFAALAASDCGWHSLYLGPNLPAEEIAGAAVANRVQGVALSIVYPAGDPRLVEELELLRRCLPSGMPILVGGRAAATYAATLDAIGAVLLNDSIALRKHLDSIRIRFS